MAKPDPAVERLKEMAEGWECAARLTDEIVKAFQPELDAFSSTSCSEPKDLRLVRAVLDERGVRDRYLRDAAALRHVLARLAEVEGERDTATEVCRWLVAADRESLADHRPKWGLADCVDNDGQPYQSQAFADVLAEARKIAGAGDE